MENKQYTNIDTRYRYITQGFQMIPYQYGEKLIPFVSNK